MDYAIINTVWGPLGFVTRAGKLVATYLWRNEAAIRRTIVKQFPGAVEAQSLLPRFQRQVATYFSGKPTMFAVNVDLSDQTPFRQAVLEACRQIPYGKMASYADLARAAGNPGAARAVGGTMAKNPIPLVIPCHRVVRSDGSVGGFSSPRGVKEKQRLLALEGITI